MAYNSPEFDFNDYNPKDPWRFPPNRMVIFAIDSMALFQKSRSRIVTRHIHPDVRFTVFHEAIQICHPVMSLGLLLRDTGQKVEWWHQQPEFKKDYSERIVQTFNMNLRGSGMSALVNGFLGLIEATLRQMLWHLDPKAPENTKGFRPVWKYMLGEFEGLRYEPVIKLLLILRDAGIYGGKFCSHLRQDLVIRFQQKDLLFENNQEFDVTKYGFLDDWTFLFELLKEVNDMFNHLIDNPQIMAVHRMPARAFED